ncbi:hypothetical protein AMECASPLE_014080 [Ameca splendens]|uniref:Uncharacterized protein n=1 Tax=Ameca splendens TaxID=208324 RepID=A0ABV0YDD2_9TELE
MKTQTSVSQSIEMFIRIRCSNVTLLNSMSKCSTKGVRQARVHVLGRSTACVVAREGQAPTAVQSLWISPKLQNGFASKSSQGCFYSSHSCPLFCHIFSFH